ncbi:phosphate acetyltransferase [Actinoplanes capillaceus]|uniref:Phosphate acetyltransferase n=1 Tax=Actinoplanes campanulatus TaxID=113559 RepID=A0ABQ3WRG3_9ACTN|nr:phosphate acetyltransferase [Actinoplanes capillaceus]GID48837.1 phosphate acetyltransferase [Actinoplanes capillaceus]
MARSVYVAGLGPSVGKGTVALGIVEALSRQVASVAVFRPMISGGNPDPLLSVLHERYPGPDPADAYGVTLAEASALVADGRWEELIGRIVERYREVERHASAAVIIGSDFADKPGEGQDELPREFAFNARLANEFGSVVVPVVSGEGRSRDSLAGAARGAYHSLVDLGTTVVAVIANRVPAAAMGGEPEGLPVPFWALPEIPAIAAPTVGEVAAALDAEVIAGSAGSLERDVLDYVVGAGQVPTVLGALTDGALLITAGDRADLLVAASAAHAAGNVTLAGLVLTLGEPADERALRVIERLNTGLAMLGTRTDSYHTIAAADRITAQLSTPRKIDAALGIFEENVDTAELSRLLDVARSSRVTPLMFENDLIEKARVDRRHLVLPEGTEERILRASETLLRRGVADLTLLGDPEEINRRAREIGVDIAGARLVDPATSEWRQDFATRYAEIRKHRGVTLDLAYDVVTDVNYFGTLMVAGGLADGMVSGATHTTAATIRPAFEIIKTVPGLTVASSVFFMLLADRVLVYGDCAVNPDPDAEQLADIALSSAQTAAAFGIEPRVAMLSYSTGSSGAGADVDKVAAATALVRQRRPDLPVEGPIQYDAAIDPAVAAAKLPGSAVAGKATVFVFPDLNTGNNTYKAVQRSANAVAVGPVMQGLRRPVNDLSRGATVKDIVNTVAITAIQAGAK